MALGGKVRREPNDIGHSSHSGLFWTSSRCHRLLRPLQSRIIALRKLAASEKAGCGQDSYENGDLDRTACHRPTKKLKVETDTEYAHNRRKPPRRTYSKKLPSSPFADSSCLLPKAPSRAQCHPRSRPSTSSSGVPSVSTPILRKVKYHIPTLSDFPTCEEGGDSYTPLKTVRRGPLESSLNKLERVRHSFRPSRCQLYEGIIHDLDAILRSTTLKKPPVGKNSLLSMCIRKVPQCAAAIEAWERSKAANHGPVSSIKQMSYSLRVYDELETLGGAGNGWSHLQALLRAHAIYILTEVIMDGLLDVAFVHILIEHCKAIECPYETAKLMEALLGLSHLKSRENTEKFCSETQGQVLVSLADLAGQTGIEFHLLETVTPLLISGHLPVATLSTKLFGFLWTATACSVLEQRAHPSATRFAATGLGLLCICSFPTRKRRRAKFRTTPTSARLTLSSVLGALSAMAMISQNFGNTTDGTETRGRGRTHRVVLQILHEAMALVVSEGGSKEAMYPLQLAIFLSTRSDLAHKSMVRLKQVVESLGGGLDPRNPECTRRNHSELFDTTIALTCSIAHCCGRATNQPSNQYFDEICKLVDRLQAPSFSTLRVDGAFLLAQKTDDLRDLVFAETITEVLTGNNAIATHIGAKATFFAGYRWEEGISEWIAVSPTAKRRGFTTREVILPRRTGKDNGKGDALLARSEPEMTTRATYIRRHLAATAVTASRPDGHQVDRRLVGRERERRIDDEDIGSMPKDVHVVDGIDELSTCQENQPRVLGKSGLRSQAVRTQGGCRRVILSKAGPRKVLAELGLSANVTGCGDDDELGL
ncbi:hypothetical protein EsH8_IV_000650 [Colletotrichum jinshuiense]